MKLRALSIIFLFFLYLGLEAQMHQPNFLFSEGAMNHNMGITSDGIYYYTVNGGNKDDGLISKYDLNGTFIASYPIALDARTIMCHAKTAELYIAGFDRSIYKITNLEEGTFVLLFEELYENGQSSPALSENGKSLYVMNKGELSIYNFTTGELEKKVKGYFCGPDISSGNTSVAADKKHIYTWNKNIMLVYKYDKKARLIDKYHVSNGDYGFSLSYANGMIFLAKDGDSRSGAWFGYEF